MVRIALDASGGDHAPEAPVAGAVEAINCLGPVCEIVLIGPRAAVEAALSRHGPIPDGITITDAPETIGMDEKPLQAIRSKPRSSIVVGLEAQKRGAVAAFVSAGNTGAVMAASRLLLGLHRGIERPAIGTLFPTVGDPVLFLDAGANIDCSPRELVGFAHLGALYARYVMNRPAPTVGLLSIGEEEEKGTPAVREAHRLLRNGRGRFRFVGNVEGRDILTGACDVVVCDGFVGNIVLKFYESVARLFTGLLEREMEEAVLASDAMRRVLTTLDYSEYGGAPLLGVQGVSVICHGRSPARAIKNAVGVALQSVENRLSEHIGAEFIEDGAAA